MSEPRVVRLGLAAVAACTAAATIYAAIRVGQAMLGTEVDPALVIYSEHAGFYWRAWTAAYAGGMVGVLAWRAEPERVARILSRAVVAAALAIALQGLLVP